MLLKSSEDVSGVQKISLRRSRMSAALRLLIGSGRVSGLTASMRFPISTRHLTFFNGDERWRISCRMAPAWWLA
jgi:hypothetical protein